MNGIKSTAIAIASTSLSNLPVWLLTSLAPSIGVTLAFGDAALGAAVAAFFGIAAIAALPAGAIVERLGWRRGTLVASILTAVALAVMGSATHLGTLVVGLGVGAVGFSFAQPCANVALAEMVSQRRQGTAFGLKQASLPLTTLVVGAAAPLFLGETRWRLAFTTFAGITAVFFVIVALVAWPAGKRFRFRLRARSGGARSASRSSPVRRHRPQPPLIVLAIGAGCGSAATGSVGGFLVVFGVSTGLAPSAAAQLLVVGSLVCLVVRLLAGWLADRRVTGHLRAVALMMFGGATGLVTLAIADRPALVVVGAALTFGIGWAWNGLYAFAVVRRHREYPATATGVMQAAIGTGSAVGPLAFGLTVTMSSYTLAWSAAAAALASGGLLILLGRHMLRTPPA